MARQRPQASKRTPLTERVIQALYWFDKGRQAELCFPNFAPPGWWECDVFHVTKAFVWYEAEIKLSMSDFRADQSKAQRMPDLWAEHPEYRVVVDPKHQDFTGGVIRKYLPLYAPGLVLKHKLLADRNCTIGPQYFSYIVPEQLTEQVKPELPPYAGLIEVRQGRAGHYFLCGVKPPVKRHKNKVAPSLVLRAHKSAYYRFWAERCTSARRKIGEIAYEQSVEPVPERDESVVLAGAGALGGVSGVGQSGCVQPDGCGDV